VAKWVNLGILFFHLENDGSTIEGLYPNISNKHLILLLNHSNKNDDVFHLTPVLSCIDATSIMTKQIGNDPCQWCLFLMAKNIGMSSIPGEQHTRRHLIQSELGEKRVV